MKLIETIEEFKERFNNQFTWFISNRCSIDVLEYCIDIGIDNMYYILYSMSRYQPLTEEFIDKYKDKLNWYCIFRNNRIKLTDEFIERNIYQFNLYEVNNNINNLYPNILNGLIFRYPDKYEIDKLEYELSKKYD